METTWELRTANSVYWPILWMETKWRQQWPQNRRQFFTVPLRIIIPRFNCTHICHFCMSHWRHHPESDSQDAQYQMASKGGSLVVRSYRWHRRGIWSGRKRGAGVNLRGSSFVGRRRIWTLEKYITSSSAGVEKDVAMNRLMNSSGCMHKLVKSN